MAEISDSRTSVKVTPLDLLRRGEIDICQYCSMVDPELARRISHADGVDLRTGEPTYI